MTPPKPNSELQLKDCPFCGCSATMGTFDSEDDGLEEGVQEGTFHNPHCKEETCVLGQGHHQCYDSEAEAIKAWNTRAKPPTDMVEKWQSIETAPKDGTWILGINNRGNQAVIIWSEDAPHWAQRSREKGEYRGGWIHPFTDSVQSTFWNGGCGSVPTHWMPLPACPKHEGGV